MHVLPVQPLSLLTNVLLLKKHHHVLLEAI
jgi:hypothetical protein